MQPYAAAAAQLGGEVAAKAPSARSPPASTAYGLSEASSMTPYATTPDSLTSPHGPYPAAGLPPDAYASWQQQPYVYANAKPGDPRTAWYGMGGRPANLKVEGCASAGYEPDDGCYGGR